MAGLSKYGRQPQSTEPSQLISTAVCMSPITP
jgi:hypothetical protein